MGRTYKSYAAFSGLDAADLVAFFGEEKRLSGFKHFYFVWMRDKAACPARSAIIAGVDTQGSKPRLLFESKYSGAAELNMTMKKLQLKKYYGMKSSPSAEK